MPTAPSSKSSRVEVARAAAARTASQGTASRHDCYPVHHAVGLAAQDPPKRRLQAIQLLERNLLEVLGRDVVRPFFGVYTTPFTRVQGRALGRHADQEHLGDVEQRGLFVRF